MGRLLERLWKRPAEEHDPEPPLRAFARRYACRAARYWIHKIPDVLWEYLRTGNPALRDRACRLASRCCEEMADRHSPEDVSRCYAARSARLAAHAELGREQARDAAMFACAAEAATRSVEDSRGWVYLEDWQRSQDARRAAETALTVYQRTLDEELDGMVGRAADTRGTKRSAGPVTPGAGTVPPVRFR